MTILNKNKLILFFILLTAFLIRFVGVFPDLPFSYYPDEEHFVNRAVSFGSGDFNPHWFHKPAFLMYLLFFEYGLYFFIGKLLGIFVTVDHFALSFFQNKGPFLLIGRLTVTTFGVATIFLVYLIGRDLFDRRTGLIAALFLTFMLGHVASSQVVKADVPTAFFTTLSFWFIYRIYNSGNLIDYALAGMFAGLGMATKYYSGVLIPTIFLAHMFYIKRLKLSIIKNIINKGSVIAALSLLCALFIASPYNFLDPMGLDQTIIMPLQKIISIGGQSIKETAGVGSPESTGFLFIKSFGHYISVAISPRAMGEIGIIALFGLTFFLIRLSPVDIITISFPILFILIANMLSPFYSEYRHLNPIYPFMAVLAAYSINYIYELLQHKTKLSRLFLIGSILILVTPPFYRVVKHDYLLTRPNTKTLAKEWIEANIPSGTRIVLDEAAVKISPDKKYYKELLRRAEGHERGQFTTHADKLYGYSLKALPDVTYDIAYIRFPWWQQKEKTSGVHFAVSDYDQDMANPLKPVGVMPFEYYKENRYKYAIVSSEAYGDFFKQNPTKARNFPSFYAFYKSLFEEGILVKEFKPDPWNSRGHVIKIFKIG